MHQLDDVLHQEGRPSVLQKQVAETERLLVRSLFLECDHNVFALLVPTGNDVSGVVPPVCEQLQLLLQLVSIQLETIDE